MRLTADELGVMPMSLHHHLVNNQQIVDGIVDRIVDLMLDGLAP